jgi:hypothetical protein
MGGLIFLRRNTNTMTDEERVKVCQAEIRRLRSVIRGNRETLQNALSIDCQNLYEMWADFDDAEAPNEVTWLIETSGMGPVDAVSFSAFCYGFYRAIQKIKEAAV